MSNLIVHSLLLLNLDCTDGETRIVNDISNEMFAGKIELCINGQWGSICDDGWSYNEAHVVCSQFGYTSYGMYLYYSQREGFYADISIVF